MKNLIGLFTLCTLVVSTQTFANTYKSQSSCREKIDLLMNQMAQNLSDMQEADAQTQSDLIDKNHELNLELQRLAAKSLASKSCE